MALIKNEETVKQQGSFLKIEAQNKLVLKSNLYHLNSHYLQSVQKSVACIGKECHFCKEGVRRNQEFYYFVNLNGADGILRVPQSVFFDIQKISLAKGKDKKLISWLVLKSGTGKETRYTTSIDDFVTSDEADVEKNNQALEKTCIGIEKRLASAYDEITSKNKQPEPEMNEVVNPDDVPF